MGVETREFLSLSHSLNYIFKYLIVFHCKRIKVFLTKVERTICKLSHKMVRLLILSVLAIPIVFHVGYADVRSDRRLVNDRDLQSSRQDTRHGKNLILDNERRMTTQFDAKIRSKNYDTNGDNGRVEEHSRLLRSIENNDIGGDGRERRSSDLRTERREEISRERRSEIHPERSLRRSNERTAQRRTNVEMRERAGLQSRENRSERGRIYGRNIPTQGRNNVEMRERAKIQTLRGAIESERNRLDDRNVPTIERNKMVRSDRAANTDSERTSRTVESHEEPRRDFDRAVNTKTDSINQMRSHIRPQEQREERRENNDNHEQRTDENIGRMPIRTRKNRREEENDEDIRRDNVEESSEERREDRQSEKRIRMRRDIERRIRNMHSDRIDVRGEISGPQIDYLE